MQKLTQGRAAILGEEGRPVIFFEVEVRLGEIVSVQLNTCTKMKMFQLTIIIS